MLGGLFFSHQGSFGGLRLAETTKLLQEEASHHIWMLSKHVRCYCKPSETPRLTNFYTQHELTTSINLRRLTFWGRVPLLTWCWL